MQLTSEQYEQLPDFIKSEYIQDGDGYVHGGVKKLKGSLDALDSKYKESASKLTDYEKRQQELQAEAEAKALERLKSEGKFDEIKADFEKRMGETQRQYDERIAKMSNAIKTEKRNALVESLASDLATDAGKTAFKRLIANRIDIDPETGSVTFLTDDGSATSLDLAGFKSEITKDQTYSALIKAQVTTTGGGLVNGGGNSSAVSNTQNSRAMEAKKKGDLAGFLKSQLGA